MKKTNKVDLRLARKMAESLAEHTIYIGLDAPSEVGYAAMDEILSSFYLNEKAEKKLRAKISNMKYADVIKLEEKVNQLLESGKYD